MPPSHKQVVALRQLDRPRANVRPIGGLQEECCGPLVVLLGVGEESPEKQGVIEATRISTNRGSSNESILAEETTTHSKNKNTNTNTNRKQMKKKKKTKTRKFSAIETLLSASLVYQLIASLVQVVVGSQQLFANNFPANPKPASSGPQAEIHQVRGLAGSGRLELPCSVDQSNCGEVYYITWTRQLPSNPPNLTVHSLQLQQHQQQQQQQQWSRVYLYTGANDSAPHKPIGDLINRAHFVMPERRPLTINNEGGGPDEELEQRTGTPLAKLVIEEPRLSDEALYKCDVTYVKGKCPSISLVRVSMMSLPNKAQIYSPVQAPRNQLASAPLATSNLLADGQLVGPFNEHEQLKLACLVQGGRPMPSSVIWRKIDLSGRTINLTPARLGQQLSIRQPDGPFVQVDLNHTLTSADLGAKFECHFDHDAIEQASARVVSNELNDPTGMRNQVDALLDLHPAHSSELTAGTDGRLDGFPADGMQLERSKSLDAHVIVDLNVGVASLDLFMAKVNRRNSSEPLKEGDLVELECVAHNSRPPANISWFNGPDSIEQLDTSTITTAPLMTVATPPPPRHQHRSRQKRLLQKNQVRQNNDGHTFTTHSFLSIKLSRHEHRSQIICQAQNSPMRQPLVKSIELQVQHAPIVLMEPAAGLIVSELPPSSSALESTDGVTRRMQADRSSEKNLDNVITTTTSAEMEGPLHQASGQVSIYCIYSSNPSQLLPNSTRWFKNGHLLDGLVGFASPSSPSNDEQNDHSSRLLDQHEHSLTNKEAHFVESFTATGYPVLTINQVNRRDAGLYDCQVSNSIGQSERLPASESCKLEVNFRPRVKLRLFRVTASRGDQSSSDYSLDELTETDVDQELVMPGGHFVFVCDVLEAQPNKIDKFHWFRKDQVGKLTHRSSQQTQFHIANANGGGRGSSLAGSRVSAAEPELINKTESGQLSLGLLAANFTASSFTCSASNSLGLSEQSSRIDIQLSYAPGSSFVRPLLDLTLRDMVLKTGKLARSAVSVSELSESDSANQPQPLPLPQQPISAGSELLLECITPDLGQPRANIWLWFKNGQPIDNAGNINNPSDDALTDQDNPINGQDLSTASQPSMSDSHHRRRNGAPVVPQHQQSPQKQAINSGLPMMEQSKIKLISSGRYLFVPSIQLIHKGNYSCVAVNRLGASGFQSSVPANLERDSYQVRVALAPSFVHPLATLTYWPEVYVPSAVATTTTSFDHSTNIRQLELVCHVQCEPICQIEWLMNNELLDYNRQKGSVRSNFVTYQVKQSIMEENVEANLFKSIESRLVLQFREEPINGHTGGEPNSAQLQLDRDRTLERRHLLNGANYTCQSSPNSMGPSVRSTTKFIVQYPPENLLINAPSDKLSLVEGGNGPRLSCESAGEPQVQYRWLLVKSSAANDLAMANQQPAKRGSKRSASISQTSSSAAGEQTDHAINQAPSKAFEFASPSSKGANDVDAVGLAETELIELAGATTEAGNAPQTSISTLDLSNLSLDRRQAGHYICEASNRLGQARQSVYVNVQYKPTCAALHLHSLDMTTKTLLDNEIRGDLSLYKSQETSFIQSGRYIKPLRAANRNEYAIVKETSGDFVNLRRNLVLSPLLNRHSNKNGDLLFRDSIFQSILNEKGSLSDGVKLSNEHNNRVAQLRDKDTLVNLHTKTDNSNQIDSVLVADSKQNENSYSWNKFNSLLLIFLNTYIEQVKTFEEQSLINNESSNVANMNANQQSNRRSSDQQSANNANGVSETSSASTGMNDPIGRENTRNLITFACMAQDGNPMSNLTFDWSFGSTNLPETDEQLMSSLAVNSELGDRKESSIKPQLVYVNDNYTVQIMLVRRLDTKFSLNPFQMSLLTLNIIVEPLASLGGLNSPLSTSSNRAIRQSEWSLLNRTSSSNNQSNLIPRVPVIRSRQPAHYNSLKALASQNNINNNNNNNIQFARELEMRPYNLGTVLPNGLDLNEENWQEQISNLLKCTVTNRIGTSEVCHARVNLAERMESSQSSTSALSEFAKWRMPSLAHKSVVIISVIVGCVLIIFVTFILLIGSYIKNLNLKSSGDLKCCKEETNTGQSTSSQKSSVLGLLGNGDSSLQSSSDDDSSARLNHHRAHHHHHHALDSQIRCQNRMKLDLRNSSLTSQTLAHSDKYHKQLPSEPSTNYDQPRGLQESNVMHYISDSFNERTPDRTNIDTLDSCHYRNELANVELPIRQDSHIFNASDLNNQNNVSTRGRLLANLKSLSRFKVDRISDLTSSASRVNSMRALHTNDISSSETNTSGLSISAFNTDLKNKLESPASSESPTFFEAPVKPQNHLNFKSQQMGEPSYDMYSHNGLLEDLESSTSKLQMQLSSQRLPSSTLTPAYSNMIGTKPLNPMDEYIRQRELDPLTLEQNNPAAFYRSQSNRNHHMNSSNPQTIYSMRKDLSQFHPQQFNRGPPVYPRSTQASTIYKYRLAEEAPRPTVIARSSNRQILDTSSTADAQQYQSSRINRMSIPSYNQSFNGQPNDIHPISTFSYMNTIDNHLSRMADTVALNQYSGNLLNHTSAYINAAVDGIDPSSQQDVYNCKVRLHNQSAEHIYDTNAYATPEQTPLRGNLAESRPQIEGKERPRVHHLIQTFNSKAPLE